MLIVFFYFKKYKVNVKPCSTTDSEDVLNTTVYILAYFEYQLDIIFEGVQLIFLRKTK